MTTSEKALIEIRSKIDRQKRILVFIVIADLLLVGLLIIAHSQKEFIF